MELLTEGKLMNEKKNHPKHRLEQNAIFNRLFAKFVVLPSIMLVSLRIGGRIRVSHLLGHSTQYTYYRL